MSYPLRCRSHPFDTEASGAACLLPQHCCSILAIAVLRLVRGHHYHLQSRVAVLVGRLYACFIAVVEVILVEHGKTAEFPCLVEYGGVAAVAFEPVAEEEYGALLRGEGVPSGDSLLCGPCGPAERSAVVFLEIVHEVCGRLHFVPAVPCVARAYGLLDVIAVAVSRAELDGEIISLSFSFSALKKFR